MLARLESDLKLFADIRNNGTIAKFSSLSEHGCRAFVSQKNPVHPGTLGCRVPLRSC